MSNQLLQIPGKVTPAFSKEITGAKLTQYNHLRNAGVVNPQILDAMAIYFAEQKCNIEALIALYGGMANVNGNSIAPKGMMGSDYQRIVNNNIRQLENWEFAWRVQSVKHKLYLFTRDAQGTLTNGKLGVGGEEFYVYMNRDLVKTDEVFRCADGSSKFMVRSVEPTDRRIDGMREVKCRVRYMLTPGIVGDGLKATLVGKGYECERAHNLKPEASAHGSNGALTSGDWMRNSMSLVRTEWNMTGHAYHQKADPKWVLYTNEAGQSFPYWYNAWEEEAMRLLYEFRADIIWDGQKAVNPDGTYLKNDEGFEYISGDGILTQQSRKMRMPYTSLSNRLFDNLALTLFEDTQGLYTTKRWVIAGGPAFRVEFSNLMASVFTNTNAKPLYFEGAGGQGVRNNFISYETPLGEFIVYNADFLSTKYRPSLRGADGYRLNNNKAYILNISEMVGGKPNMMLLSQMGRTNVSGSVVGMANVGENGGVLTTTKDVAGKHYMTSVGVAVTSPNSIIELYKTAA
jgi:hypothetical protein